MKLSSMIVVLCVVAAGSPALSAQLVRRGELGAEQRAHLAALGPAGSGLVIDALRGGHVAQKVLGPLPLSASGLQARCAELVARHGVLFGATAAMEFGAPVTLREQPGAPGQPLNVRLPQSVQGFPLAGHGLWLRFDAQGQLACVHGVLSEAAAQLAAPALSPTVAEGVALARLAQLGHAAADFASGPRTLTLARLVAGSPRLVHETHVVLRQGWMPLVVTIDATSGAVLGVRENRSSATGHYHFDGQVLPFATGTGKGLVYKTVAGALASKPGAASLTEVGEEDVVLGLAENGDLFGRFATIIDDANFIFASPSHNWTVTTDDDFVLDDPFTDAQLFDHTNTYFWISKMGHFMEGPFGKPLGMDYSIPVIVNVDSLLNAFYTPDDVGLDTGPGFFAFGDADSQTDDSMDDFSRDPTVICHEYTHGVCDKAGLFFGDADIDTPPRAVNEAIADFFSAAFNKTPCIGPVFAFWFLPDFGGSGDCLRNLADERVFPEDLFFETGDTGLPEEHEAGVIFGATEWRFSKALKGKGPGAVADSMFDWPESNAEVGFPVVDTGNAQAAYLAFMSTCAFAMLDSVAFGPGAGSATTKVSKVLGATMANGLVGSAADGTAGLFQFGGGGKVTLSSEFIGGHAQHDVLFAMDAGDVASVSVKGQAGTQVDFTLDEADGDLDFTQPRVLNAAGTSATQAKINVLAPGTFVLHVTNPGGLGGAYKCKVVVK